MSNWQMKEAGLHNLAWQNTKHSVHITLYLRRDDWEVNLGQGSGFSHYLAIDHKNFPTKASALKHIDKLKRKYNNGWM